MTKKNKEAKKGFWAFRPPRSAGSQKEKGTVGLPEASLVIAPVRGNHHASKGSRASGAVCPCVSRLRGGKGLLGDLLFNQVVVGLPGRPCLAPWGNGVKRCSGLGSVPTEVPLSPNLVLSPANTTSYLWERAIRWSSRAELRGL